MFFIISNSLIFGCAGSSLLHNLFSNCKGHGLLSGYSVRAANCSGFSCRDRLQSTQASVAAASGLSSTGSVVAQYELSCPWHMGSSQTKDWTHVSCTGRQMLYHWATREAPNSIFETNFIWCQNQTKTIQEKENYRSVSLNIDTEILDKMFPNWIQQYVKNKWVLSQECKALKINQCNLLC